MQESKTTILIALLLLGGCSTSQNNKECFLLGFDRFKAAMRHNDTEAGVARELYTWGFADAVRTMEAKSAK